MGKLDTKITEVKLKKNLAEAYPTATALVALNATDDADIYTATTGVYGLLLPCEEKDSKTLIFINNVHGSAEKTAILKAGNAEVWGGLNDLSVTVAAGATKVLCVDSARFKFVSGKYKNYMVVVGADASIKVAIVALP